MSKHKLCSTYKQAQQSCSFIYIYIYIFFIVCSFRFVYRLCIRCVSECVLSWKRGVCGVSQSWWRSCTRADRSWWSRRCFLSSGRCSALLLTAEASGRPQRSSPRRCTHTWVRRCWRTPPHRSPQTCRATWSSSWEPSDWSSLFLTLCTFPSPVLAWFSTTECDLQMHSHADVVL